MDYSVENMKLMKTAFNELRKQPHSSITLSWDKGLITIYCHDKDNAMMTVIEASSYVDDIHISKEKVITIDEYKIEIKF